MASESRTPRLAVLIDADNASAKIADGLFAEIARKGDASVRRIYGDFSSPRLTAWSGVLSRHSILPQQQIAYATGKNSSDIALVIDAMDLLHSREFDGFCLVSSDSDFTHLATRLREAGVEVYGFGTKKTLPSFRQACREFIFTEKFLPAASKITESTRSLADAERILNKIIAEIRSKRGWANLSEVGNRLTKMAPVFEIRDYGVRKLSDLVQKIDSLEFHPTDGRLLRIRPRPAASNKSQKSGG